MLQEAHGTSWDLRFAWGNPAFWVLAAFILILARIVLYLRWQDRKRRLNTLQMQGVSRRELTARRLRNSV